MITKKCIKCKKEFKYKDTRRPGKFCSHACQIVYYRKQIKPKIIKRMCKTCNKKFTMRLSQFKQDSKYCNAGKFCSKECFYKSPERSPNLGKKGKDSLNWKGGRIYERGYRLVLAQNHPNAILKGGGLKYIREHRLIMEQYLGRYLKENEIVHHINGDISDNRIENLQLYKSHAEHNRFHKNNYWKNKSVEDKCKGEINGTKQN